MSSESHLPQIDVSADRPTRPRCGRLVDIAVFAFVAIVDRWFAGRPGEPERTEYVNHLVFINRPQFRSSLPINWMDQQRLLLLSLIGLFTGLQALTCCWLCLPDISTSRWWRGAIQLSIA
ncbi:hypothetical protein Pla100_32490 [Neorhodopirellula pilleata]|uniref:Uncharacterized protein n=1 Tax=Neorhodopirellula pilleata TaxID=2714738 RepID=A0A5C6A8I4_9BACT|nr:hypothetical protein Pla100_32490 [Neorhodopirellula pilleata]